MAITPRTRAIVERRKKRESRQGLAAALGNLGKTLLALQDRKRAIKNEEEKLRREGLLLDLRLSGEERLRDDLELQRSAEDRIRGFQQIDADLDAAKFEETKAENLRAQARHTEKERRLAGRSAAAKTGTSVQERAAQRFRETVLADFESSPGKSIFNQIIREVTVSPNQAGYADAFRKKAAEFLMGTVDRALSEKHGRVIMAPGILGDLPNTDQMQLYEEAIQWMAKNAKKLNWSVPDSVLQEIISGNRTPPIGAITQGGAGMPLTDPMRGGTPTAPQQKTPVPGEEDEFQKALLGGY